MQILEILFEGVANVAGHAGLAAGGLHRVERSCESDRKIVKMALKIAIAGETETANDANDGSGVGFKTLGHRTHAEEDVVARVLENRANNFLALGAEEFNALGKRGGRDLRRNWWSFHGARELPKTLGMSTLLNSLLR